MSNKLATFYGVKGTNKMELYAYAGKDFKKNIIISVMGEDVYLDENQVRELVLILLKRLWSVDGYSATDPDLNKEIWGDEE